MNTENTEPSTEQTGTDDIDTQRRNITKLAFWTPPVMMTLMLSKRASAASVVTEALPDAPPTWGGY
jgi:hypothetical protein